MKTYQDRLKTRAEVAAIHKEFEQFYTREQSRLEAGYNAVAWEHLAIGFFVAKGLTHTEARAMMRTVCPKACTSCGIDRVRRPDEDMCRFCLYTKWGCIAAGICVVALAAGFFAWSYFSTL